MEYDYSGHITGGTMHERQLKDIKASFSSVVDQAVEGVPTIVTRHGKRVAVVLSYEEWQALHGARPSFADLLLAFPDVGEITRDTTPPRDLGLE
jgi:prevent-host-death family protein